MSVKKETHYIKGHINGSFLQERSELDNKSLRINCIFVILTEKVKKSEKYKSFRIKGLKDISAMFFLDVFRPV